MNDCPDTGCGCECEGSSMPAEVDRGEHDPVPDLPAPGETRVGDLPPLRRPHYRRCELIRYPDSWTWFAGWRTWRITIGRVHR